MEPTTKDAQPAADQAPKKPRSVWVVCLGDQVLAVFSSIHKVATYVDQRTGVELRIAQWEVDK